MNNPKIDSETTNIKQDTRVCGGGSVEIISVLSRRPPGTSRSFRKASLDMYASPLQRLELKPRTAAL